MTSSTQDTTATGQRWRPVAIVHTPLKSFNCLNSAAGKSLPKSLAKYIQAINHYGIRVANFDSATGEITSTIRFGLKLVKDANGEEVVDVDIEHDADPQEYKNVHIFLTHDVTGLTSFSDKKLEDIAHQEIGKHGKYALLRNNCQNWAVEYFNAICDVKDNKVVKANGVIGKVSKKKRTYLALLGIAALAVSNA